MATAVLDLELERLPIEITGLARYSRALALVRRGGLPIGQAMLPVLDGHIDGAELRSCLASFADLQTTDDPATARLRDRSEPTADAVLPSATVAVCTRERPEHLQRCLDALLLLPDDGQELLVVDNCPSTGATQQVVQCRPRVRYVREDSRGLDIARNRALREAQNEVVAFIDDDAVADLNWLRALLRPFERPSVLAVTGLTFPRELETAAQEWFQAHCPFDRGFARRVFRRSDIRLGLAGDAGAGANMALRRSALQLVGPFDEALDAGTPTRSGGDTEMFTRILRAGYEIVYEPAALSWHTHRRTRPELRETLYGYGLGVYAVITRQILVEHDLACLLSAAAWLLLQQLPGLIGAIVRKPDALPVDLLLAELRGCVAGPGAYVAARSRAGQGKVAS